MKNNKKEYLIIVVTMLLTLSIVYPAYSFINLSWNPATWSRSSRFWSVCWFLLISYSWAVGSIKILRKKIKKQNSDTDVLKTAAISELSVKLGVTKEQYDKAWSDLQVAELGYNESHADFTARKAGYQKIISDYRQP